MVRYLFYTIGDLTYQSHLVSLLPDHLVVGMLALASVCYSFKH